ncbi:MAG: hypothetical protein OXM61_11655 [Candidatus Poribacteria bacterium]|nr:hypothetical protein [Candidatus Poribacteria bacterium]
MKHFLGQHSESILDYDKAIDQKPAFTEAYINRGVMKSRLGNTCEAKEDLLTALQLAEHTTDVRLKQNIMHLLQDLE